MSVLARLDDGTIQLAITIPVKDIQKAKEEAFAHIVSELEVPGFRKGKAPADIAQKYADPQKIFEHALGHLLPEFWADAVEEHKLKPVLAPKFELLSVKDGEDWTIRAITCELPEVDIGDYKKTVSQLKKTDQPSREEKEQKVIKILIEAVKIKIPRLLVEEEVNHKLARLLDQVQKLGLTIESYLTSTGKTVDKLKEEYAKQAEDSIKLELALNKIAQDSKLKVSKIEIEQIVQASGDERNRQLVKNILLRRKALDYLVGLI